ncbi:hypothetical protein [Mesorhizobium wenxiniae]|uniref:Nucleotide exchange factor GrpE n=1 Tax=Mesorhizobium wenxiniae TaxID=2014805 RepID=A0A271KK20_9HYPH|nr:hypothetical protein [Mesorhizobium wenxiniae]PAP95457.1 hypothetical protein CIT31_15830 [Mesorhizobium wenxiniae]
MADNPNEAAKPTETQRDAQEALEKQVAQLKREINKINRSLAERAEEVVEEATGWYEGAADSVSRTTQALRKGRLRLPASFKKTLARCRPPSCWVRL